MAISINTHRLLLASAVGVVLPTTAMAQEAAKQPNIIVLLADDLGWGDVGFAGNNVVKTPAMDALSQQGATLTNAYTVSPLSSPTRGSVLTGRHPFRFGVLAAHTGAMRQGEITLSEVCQDNGYATGFFGKWHLGWIESDVESISDRGFYSPPEYHGFEEVFATRSAVPTWNPTVTPDNFNSWGNKAGEPWKGSRYIHNGEIATENLDGDDSRVIIDRVLPFIDKSIEEEKPFLACVWFHAPHEPVVAGPDYLAMYSELENETQRHYYGCITAMDDQIGRLQQYLEEKGLAENTIIVFSSDNGPADSMVKKGAASAGPYRGHKHEIYEGGLRVPTFIHWKGNIPAGVKVETQTTSCDFFPTIIDLAQLKFKHNKEYIVDGMSVTPAFEQPTYERTKTIFAAWMRKYRDTYGRAIIKGDYKLLYPEKTKEPELYNLAVDPYETNNIIEANQELAQSLMKEMMEIEYSCQESRDGADYKAY